MVLLAERVLAESPGPLLLGGGLPFAFTFGLAFGFIPGIGPKLLLWFVGALLSFAFVVGGVLFAPLFSLAIGEGAMLPLAVLLLLLISRGGLRMMDELKLLPPLLLASKEERERKDPVSSSSINMDDSFSSGYSSKN